MTSGSQAYDNLLSVGRLNMRRDTDERLQESFARSRNYRSISPMTMSNDPTMAGISASGTPWQI